MLSSEITTSINRGSGSDVGDSFSVDFELYVKKSKKYLQDAARKAAAAAASNESDSNGNQKELKLELEDPLSYWVVQVS